MLPVCVQTLYVPDLQEAIRFHGAALGYEVKATYGPCIAQLKTGSTTLILQEIEPGMPPEAHGTVLCFETQDIHASMRAVVEAGGTLVHREPQPCPVGVFAMFKDGAGGVHELLQFEGGRQPAPSTTMAKVTSNYRWFEGARFDHAYYASEHMRIARELLSPLGLLRLESDRTVGRPAAGAVVATSNVWFASVDAARAALQRAGAALAADLPKYTDIRPDLHISEVTTHHAGSPAA